MKLQAAEAQSYTACISVWQK